LRSAGKSRQNQLRFSGEGLPIGVQVIVDAFQPANGRFLKLYSRWPITTFYAVCKYFTYYF